MSAMKKIIETKKRVLTATDKKYFRLFFIFSVFFVAPFFSWAATTLVSHSTNFETYSTTSTGAVIYAGRTNNTNSSSCTVNSTCNTCSLDTTTLTANSVCGLNEVQAGNTFSVTIAVKDSSISSASTARIKLVGGSTDPTVVSSSTYSNNSTLTISTTWSSLCQNSTAADSSCSKSFSSTYRFGYGTSSDPTEYVEIQIKFRYVDGTLNNYQTFGCSGAAAAEGFCYFHMYPGDGKAYIIPTFNPSNTSAVVADYSDGTGGSDVSGIKYKYLRVLYADGTTNTDVPVATDFSQAQPYATNLSLNTSTYDVSPRKITGLQNDITSNGSARPYMFITANVDQAGIVTNYSDPDAMCRVTYGNATEYDDTPPKQIQCVIPQKVYGLLDGQECFIATATYGSAMAPEVETFRQFRGQFLLTNPVGRLLVRTYYRLSPPMAEFISHHEELRLLSRILLFPMLLFVKIALNYGMIWSLLAFLFTLSATIFSFAAYKNYRRKYQSGKSV